MNIGVLVNLHTGTDVAAELQKVKELELQSCQLCIWEPALYTDDTAAAVRAAREETGVEISGLWAGWTGPQVWDFFEGPATLGLVPAAYRFKRLEELFAASDFAEKIGVTDVITHVGFLPENPHDPDFVGVVAALRHLTSRMKEKGQYFLFETGQETPITLVRAIETIGTGNLGINFDTANLILYGKANSADAVDVFGQYVRNLHCKDGEYPTCGRNLGVEKPLGQGRANMPLVLERLFAKGYTGPLTIEREISGEEQIRDIVAARDMLREIAARLGH